MRRDVEVADRRMTTAIKLVLAQAFVAGATALVRQLMGCDFNHNMAKTARIWLNASTARIWLKTHKRVTLSISMG
jgi:hypothetical protein